MESCDGAAGEIAQLGEGDGEGAVDEAVDDELPFRSVDDGGTHVDCFEEESSGVRKVWRRCGDGGGREWNPGGSMPVQAALSSPLVGALEKWLMLRLRDGCISILLFMVLVSDELRSIETLVVGIIQNLLHYRQTCVL